MLPSIKDWLASSWADYRRRWLPLMAVLAVSGLVTAFAVLLPVVPAGIAGLGGAGNPWLVWSAAFTLSLLAGLYLSTWGQAAAMRAASSDERAGPALRDGWRQTPEFAWVLSLVMLAAGGGCVLLIVPGLILGVLLFFAPFYQISGEERGMGAVELSFARVRPVLGPVSTRLFLAGLIATLPSFVPYLGWLLGPLWAPFGLVACARLADDLKTLSPAPERPRLAPAIGALSAVFILAAFAVTWSAARTAAALSESFASGRMSLPDPETAQSMLAVLQGTGTEEDARRSTTYVLTLSSAPAAPR